MSFFVIMTALTFKQESCQPNSGTQCNAVAAAMTKLLALLLASACITDGDWPVLHDVH